MQGAIVGDIAGGATAQFKIVADILWRYYGEQWQKRKFWETLKGNMTT